MWEFNKPLTPFFSDIEKKQVAVLFEAILPGGPDNPGATDVGAAEYLAELLSRDDSTYYEIRDWKPMYTAGLKMLSSAAAGQYGGRTLEQLEPAQTADLLSRLAQGSLAGFPNADWQKKFFGVIRSHCIEGCFSDQRWGGNQANIMWQWYGYPTGPSVPFVRGNPDRALPRNPGPSDSGRALSGNTSTAAKDLSETQSSTVSPDLLAAAIAAADKGD